MTASAGPHKSRARPLRHELRIAWGERIRMEGDALLAVVLGSDTLRLS